jgi:hypothetical protein
MLPEYSVDGYGAYVDDDDDDDDTGESANDGVFDQMAVINLIAV